MEIDLQIDFVWIKGQPKKMADVSDSDEDEYKSSGNVYDSDNSDIDSDDDVDEVGLTF